MIYLLVPVFKRLNLTTRLVASLDAYLPEQYTLIISDDDPEYGHLDIYSEEPHVHVVLGNGSLYWGGGINNCIEYLQDNFSVDSADIVAFVNNDVTIDAQTFGQLNAILEKHANQAIVHPVIYDEKGKRVVAGSQIACWFPFLTRHDTALVTGENAVQIDLASARFLMMNYQVLQTVGIINPKLPHYGGDNDFVLRAKQLGIPSFIVGSSCCYVDEAETGDKVGNMAGIKTLAKSFFNIKSPNSIKYRYRFVNSHMNAIFAAAVVLSMSLKAIAAYFAVKLRS